jgi:four helix bundle protein
MRIIAGGLTHTAGYGLLTAMSDYRKLEAWKLAHEARLAVYRVTAAYPAEERFALVDQTRRAASSIPSNIAEGAGHDSRREYARFLTYALASANEVEDHLLVARDLGYLPAEQWIEISADLARVRAMLTRLRQFMRRRASQRATGDG